jgi:hypothetical protein
MSRHFIIAVTIAMVGFAGLAWADDDCPKANPIEGKWVAEESFETPGGPIPSLPCFRNYVCVSENEANGQQTMSDPACKRVYHYPPAKRHVAGVCSAGGGAADSCNECLTNPPDDPCEYHYEHE